MSSELYICWNINGQISVCKTTNISQCLLKPGAVKYLNIFQRNPNKYIVTFFFLSLCNCLQFSKGIETGQKYLSWFFSPINAANWNYASCFFFFLLYIFFFILGECFVSSLWKEIHTATILMLKMIIFVLEKELLKRKYTKQKQPIHFSPTQQKNNENKN